MMRRFTPAQSEKLKRILRPFWDDADPRFRSEDGSAVNVLGEERVTLDTIIGHLDGLADAVHRGKFDVRASAQRAKEHYEFDRFLVACRRLRDVYQSLGAGNKRLVDFFAFPSSRCDDSERFGVELKGFIERVDRALLTPKRGRGAPKDYRRLAVAEAVGQVLVVYGVRSRHRTKDALPRSRTGYYARTLEIVFNAANLPLPENDQLFALIVEVVPRVAWRVQHLKFRFTLDLSNPEHDAESLSRLGLDLDRIGWIGGVI